MARGSGSSSYAVRPCRITAFDSHCMSPGWKSMSRWKRRVARDLVDQIEELDLIGA